MSNPVEPTSSPAAEPNAGMSAAGARKLEYGIIGLGIVALILIFQPFSVTFFAIGSGLVVLAGLINNLLPLAQPGVKTRSVITIGMMVGMIFGIVLLVSILAAYLYGVAFLTPPDPNTAAGKAMAAAPKFWEHRFTQSVAVVTAILAFFVWWRSRAAK
jgi:hypothetical protein